MDHDVNYLRSLIDYDDTTGSMFWKARSLEHFASGTVGQVSSWNRRYAGKPVGRVSAGYVQTMVLGQRVMVHRLAWMVYYNRPIPKGAQIDHINGNKTDNRIMNLRLCSGSQNQSNIERRRAGIRGAHYHKGSGKWQASIKIHLGSYDTQQEAASAFEAIAKKLQGEFYLPNGKRVSVRGGPKPL